VSGADQPPLERGEPTHGSIQDKLRDAIHSSQPAELDDGHLALVGVVLEAWAVEVDGDLPADAPAPAARDRGSFALERDRRLIAVTLREQTLRHATA